jgi:gentisate 1,2-dioxygenase
VWQVFAGSGSVLIGGNALSLEHGDLFVVPSWVDYELTSGEGLDLFRFSDAPIFEALGQYRTEIGRR